MRRRTFWKLLTAAALALPLGFVVPSSVAHAAVDPPIRANANGSALTDSGGNAWLADRAYTSGSWGHVTRYGSGSTGNAIAGTADDAIYQSYNLFHNWTGYQFDVPDGTYQVTLKMMEDWATAAGHRVFDVKIENTTVLSGFDIFAACGKFTACDRTFSATVSDGQLNVGFAMNGGANYGTVSGIEVTGGSGGGDTTPPSAPSDLRSTGKTSSSVSLAWNASTDNVGVTGYEVYRGSTKVATVSGTSHTDTGLSANTTYAYTVKARDAAGNLSPASNQVTVTTDPDDGGGGDTTPPSAPSDLRSTGKTSSSVSLAWNASTDDVGVTGYEVYRGSTRVATVSGTSHTVTGLSPSTSYTFTVKAHDAAGNQSAASNAVTVTTESDGGGGGGDKLIGYFAEWGVYQRDYHVKNIHTSGSASKLTHIMYAFGNVQNGQCTIGDSYAAYDKFYNAADSVDGESDTWDTGALRGNFNQLRKLKQMHPHLKVVWSFGGWTWSGGFGQAAANPAAFADSCYNLVNDSRWADVFDGIDIDWEYPNACGLSCDSSGFSAYKDLMQALRARFGGQLVTSAITADATSGGKIDAADYAGAAQHVDWYMVMTYDFFGAWDSDGPTAPHSPLRSYSGIPIQAFHADAAIQKLKGKGIPASKLLLGIGFYGRGWAGVSQSAPGGSASGAAPGTYEQGIEDYKVLKTKCPSTGTVGGTAYAHCGDQWWGYDTPATIGGKMSYANSQGLGGAFFWELSGDTSNGELITAMNNGLG